MDGNLEAVALRLGVLLLAVGLGGYSIVGLVSGRTTGYYRSHTYTRSAAPAPYYRWILLRAILAALCLLVWRITAG
jgi:hypothetical protein